MKNFLKENYVTLVTSGYVCALMTFVAMLQEHDLTNFGKIGITGIGTIAVLMGVIFKNIVATDKFNWYNILAAILGCALVAIAISIGTWFNILSA